MLSNPPETLTSISSYDNHATLITNHPPRAQEAEDTSEHQAGEETPRRSTNARCKRRALALFRRGHPRNKTESPARCNIRRRTSSPSADCIFPSTRYLTLQDAFCWNPSSPQTIFSDSLWERLSHQAQVRI